MIREKYRFHLQVIFPDRRLIFHEFFVLIAIKLPHLSEEIFINALVPSSDRFVGLAWHGAHWVGYLTLFFTQLTLDICFELYSIFIEFFFCKLYALGHEGLVDDKSFKWRRINNDRGHFFSSFCLLLFLDFGLGLFLRRWLFLEELRDLLDNWLRWFILDLWFKIFNGAHNLVALNADGFYFFLEFLKFLLDILDVLRVVLSDDNLAVILVLTTCFLDYLAITHLTFHVRYIIFLLFDKSDRIKHMICWNNWGTRHYLRLILLCKNPILQHVYLVIDNIFNISKVLYLLNLVYMVVLDLKTLWCWCAFPLVQNLLELHDLRSVITLGSVRCHADGSLHLNTVTHGIWNFYGGGVGQAWLARYHRGLKWVWIAWHDHLWLSRMELLLLKN